MFYTVLQLLCDKFVIYIVPLVFLLRPHPDQYYCHWRCTASASQSWVCRSLLVTGNNGAFSMAGELLWVIAALSHGCLRGMIEASLERSQIVHWKQLWWLPSMRKNLLDVTKVLTSFPALAGPVLGWSQHISKCSQVFIGNSSIR